MSLVALFFISPVFLFIAFLIVLDSRGPVFFRQVRVGLRGKHFRIHKFRTMVCDAEHLGPQITVGDDSRITRVGRWLRQTKLDELPQLIDVLVGNMSFVGPRPEVPSFVAIYPKAVRELVLSVRPGITDFASIMFRDESSILSHTTDPSRTYVEHVLPTKLELACEYVNSRSLHVDLKCLLHTLDVLLLSPIHIRFCPKRFK